MIGEQPLGHPGGPRLTVEPGLLKCRRPLAAEVGADRPALAARLCGASAEHGPFEFEHARLIDLVEMKAGRPLQAVRAGIETGAENHGLPDPVAGGGEQVVVIEARADADVTATRAGAGPPGRRRQPLDRAQSRLVRRRRPTKTESSSAISHRQAL